MNPISFGTDGWRATLDTFTAPRVRMVGQGVATYLREEGHTAPVAVGYDARDTSRGFAEELARVLCVNGFDAFLPERDCPTPLVAWAVRDCDLSGALMITASHNPPEYNGVKFIPEDGAPALPDVTEKIEANLAEAKPLPEDEWGRIEEVDFTRSHAEHTLDLVADYATGSEKADEAAWRDALDGLSVAYDAMYGSGRDITDALLERAGASVERIHCEYDPEFGGAAPEPTAGNLETLIERVRDGEAVLGLANDGDADRIAVVTPERGRLDGNLLFAALYDYLLETHAGPAIRTVSTTFLLDRIAATHGEEVIETPVGFKWVARAMADHDALAGGEDSGGFSLRGHVREKDGVLTALLAAVAEADESLDSRVSRLLSEHGEIQQDRTSVDCPDAEKSRVLDALDGELPETVAGRAVEAVATTDGFKILLADGSWVLVRPSGTEPKLRVYAEAETQTALRELLEAGRGLVEPHV